jgi:hypothetical protein
MNIVTAVAILLILFAVRFALPFGVIMLVKWVNTRFTNRLA